MLQSGPFTRDWLLKGFAESAPWEALGDDRVAAVRTVVSACLDELLRCHNPNGAETEAKLV